jgi:hypothetical protein
MLLSWEERWISVMIPFTFSISNAQSGEAGNEGISRRKSGSDQIRLMIP